MNRPPQIIILCSPKTDTLPIVSLLTSRQMQVVVARDVQDALEKVKTLTFDLAIVESQIDSASGLAVLSEMRRISPDTLRIILENKPIEVPLRALVNEIAPVAIFDSSVDGSKIAKLLEEKDQRTSEAESIHHSGEETDIPQEYEIQGIMPGTRNLTEKNKEKSVQYISTLLSGMMNDPELQLPILPEIAEQVRKLLKDEQNSFKQIAAWVEREPSMSTRIMQVANSPIYTSREPIHNLSQAVSRLGLRETRNILEAVITENLFITEFENIERIMRDLWLHSLCTAYCNEKVALALGIPKSEDFFMIGLLHDVGKLLIIHLLETGCRNGTWGSYVMSEDFLAQLMKRRHNDLGTRLMRNWDYPYVFQEVIRHHNAPDLKRHQDTANLVTRFSNMLTNQLGYDCHPTHVNEALSEALHEKMNISKSDQEELELSLVDMIERIKRSCFTQFHHR